MKQPIISAQGLKAGYGNRTIWQGADFEVLPGQFIGLLGSNGAGKTSLFKLLLGLEKPQTGQLELFGAPPRRGNQRIGYLPQSRDVDFDNQLAAVEYVRLGVFGAGWGLSFGKRAKRERRQALQTLELVGASQLANQPLSRLSGGERQRVFLAQALAGKPELLLLDEPLASLDLRRETQLVRLIRNIAKKQNIAVLLIAHDINPLLPVIDRIIYIANQRLVSGQPDQVINSKTLSNMYGTQVEVVRSPHGRLAVLGLEEATHHD